MLDKESVDYRRRVNNHVDGFALNTAINPSPYVYQWACIESMLPVRVANNYRPKIYAVPDQSVYPVARVNPPTTFAEQPGMLPLSDYTTQVRMLPGTIVLGLGLTVLNYVPEVYTASRFLTVDSLYLHVADDTTGIPFFSDWIAEINFNVPMTSVFNFHAPIEGVYYVAKTAWLPLTKPRLITPPGLINVTISYNTGAITGVNIAPQVILQCAEPSNVIRPVGSNNQ